MIKSKMSVIAYLMENTKQEIKLLDDYHEHLIDHKRWEWWHGNLIIDNTDINETKHYIQSQDLTIEKMCVDSETISQYTGLKDSTGKRIFEGDILEFWQPEYDLTDKSWGMVRYFADEDYPAFDIEILNVDSNGLSYIMANCECNIIGNIHDQPELINGTK